MRTDRTPPTLSTSHNLLTPDEAAELLAVKTATLAVWRSNDRYDLPYVRVGRCIRYRREDVQAFIQSNTVSAGDTAARR